MTATALLDERAAQQRPRPGVRLDSLTGLRFPAALAVLLFHSALPELPLFADPGVQQGYYHWLSQAGGLGVTFFFLLSGFVLTWSASAGDRPASFYRRRFVKILPLYYVTALLAVLVMHAGSVPWRDLAAYLTMTQVWPPDYPLNFSVLAPGWSLATEAFFYLTFPLLVGLVVGRGTRRAATVLVVSVLAVVAVPLLATLLPEGSQRLSNEPDVSGLQYWFAYVLPLTRLPDFGVGMALAVLVRADALPRLSLRWSFAALAGAYVLALSAPVLLAQRAVLVVPCALVIAAAAQRDLAGRPSVWRAGPLRWLGEISFAFYLLHFIVLDALDTHVLHGPTDSVPAAVAYLLGAVVLTVLGAGALYRWVEMPLVRAYGGRTVRGLRPRRRVEPRAARTSTELIGPTSVRSVLLPGPREVAVVQRPAPVPGPGDLLVRVRLLGLCGTDLGFYDGSSSYLHDGLAAYPFVPGHEWTGEVVAVGAGVEDTWVGRRVAGHNIRACGRCEHCAARRITHCPDRREIGVLGDGPGAAADLVVVPVSTVVAVPDALSDTSAALLEPASAAVHAMHRVDVSAGDRVAVVGAGTLGLVAAQAARARGADVLVVEPRKEARDLAASLGLVAVERPAATHGESFDVVVEASGSTVGLVSAIGLAASGGRVAQLGTPHHAVDGVPVADLVVRDLSVVGVLSGVGHWEELVDLVVAGHVDLDAMVDRVVPLEDVRSAYERLADPLRVRPKVLLDFLSHPTTEPS